MTLGSYGKVTFRVSSNVVETFRALKWSSSASYTQHKVHGQKAVPEFTGVDSDKITFEMTLSAMMGVNPSDEIVKLHQMLYERKGYSLVLGTNVYGKWLLTNISREFQHVYKDGILLQCKVSVTLLEMG